MIGLPNGTSVWQVGDSSEHNGSFKIAMNREKDKLATFKQRLKLNIDFRRYNVIPILNRAVADSLMNVGKELKSFNGIELKNYYNMRRKKSDGPLPPRVANLRVFANLFSGRDTIELKDYSMNQGAFSDDLVDSVLQDNQDPTMTRYDGFGSRYQ